MRKSSTTIQPLRNFRFFYTNLSHVFGNEDRLLASVDKMIAVPSADAEAARLRAALSAQIDVVRALESSVGELSAAHNFVRALNSESVARIR